MILENLEFGKYHGLGNDYVIINNISGKVPEEKMSVLALKLCRFHYSIGADGLILACESDKADVRMRIFNNDSSEAEMCGNGIRCFSKFIYEEGIVKKEELKIDTLKGILIARLTIKDDKVESVQIDMGAPILECENIPVIPIKNKKTCINEPLEIFDKVFNFTAVSMGNPHAIIFVDEQLNNDDLKKYGEAIEDFKRFPNKTNVEFVKVISETEAILRVYERGVGITKSCGTGNCSAVVAGTLLNKFKKNTPILMHNDGGNMTITYTGDSVLMEGPIEKVFKGIIDNLEF